MYNGRTVEVVDTDAEGRIVLGDALAYSTAHADAAAVLSVATLTGTQIHATGVDIAALIGRDQSVIDQVMAASARCTDRVWQLPRVAEYGPLLKSGIADMTNRSEAPAASAFAALFLESFIDDTPWAHIDMAAVATPRPRHPRRPGRRARLGRRVADRTRELVRDLTLLRMVSTPAYTRQRPT